MHPRAPPAWIAMRVFPAPVAMLLLALAPASPVAAQEAVVHAILFYSPTCPHCHEVINQHLPPLRPAS